MNAVNKSSAAGGDFIDSFSCSAKRPPVPGEEDDQQRASASKKTVDGYVHTGMHEGRLLVGISDRCTGGRLSVGAVRRSKAPDGSAADGCHKHLQTKLEQWSDAVDPPLGFEPEGSASESPYFKENYPSTSSSSGHAGTSGCASYLRWAESLKQLLEDSEGVRLFKQFLDQEQGCSAALDFWFACSGLKMVTGDPERFAGLAKMVYKHYVKGDRLRVSADIRRRIVDRLRQRQIDQTLFDEAQAYVEHALRSDDYPLFLKSDTYLQYVQCGASSPQTATSSVTLPVSNNVSVSNDCIIRSLPTVAEDEELALNDLKVVTTAPLLSLTPSALCATMRAREAVTTSSYLGKLAHPYHVSYAPVSAQDSELQSLSSDALTDDTLSYTDSSVDGRERAVHCIKRKQLKAIRRNADVNQHTNLIQPLIPRTERVPVDSNTAQSNPEQFAQMLSEKLQRFKDEQDKFDRITTSLHSIDDSDASHVLDVSVRSSIPSACALNTTAVEGFPFTTMLLRSVMTDSGTDDNAQSILEEHVSRVWESSNGPTPGTEHSPGLRTPSRPVTAGRGVMTSSGGLSSKGHTSGLSKLSANRTKDDPSWHEEKVRHAHRHGPSALCKEFARDLRHSKQHGVSSRIESTVGTAVDTDTRRAGTRRSVEPVHSNSSATSHVCGTMQDSLEATKERVLLWVLDNEKYSGGKTRCSTDGSDRGSSHKRSSHKSSSSTGAKKGAQHQSTVAGGQLHRSHRSESLDRNHVSGNDVLRHQQRVAGHDLPLLSHMSPNLNDSKRHTPAAELKLAALKSGLHTGVNGAVAWDGPPTFIPVSTVHSGLQMSAALSSSCEDLTLCGIKPDNKVMKKCGVDQAVITVVGYYFCDEPIPYRTTIPWKNVTLGQFKQHIAKKGNYRYFFKTVCDEFESGVVNEEVTCDNAVLPMWEGKVVGKVERIC